MKGFLCILCLIVRIATIYGRKGFGPGEQDWGYVTVRPDAYMFWWLYETTANVVSPLERPLVIWLQGGPGSASTSYGNFAEIGPLDMDLNERNHTWVRNYNVLFIDNPVGTGFSYVSNLTALTTTNQQIAEDLVTCMDGFFAKRDDFRFIPLYIAAESYGGKMAVDFALELHKRIKPGKNEANLLGITLIDSWVSPIDSVMNWAPYLLHIGAIDKNGYNEVNTGALRVKTAIEQENFELATREWSKTERIISNVSYGIDFYNILKKIPFVPDDQAKKGAEVKSSEDIKLDALMNGPVRETLGLKVNFGEQSRKVFSTLRYDFMRPVISKVEEILNNTRIDLQVLTGQLDLIVDTPGTVKWVDRLHFPKELEPTRWADVPRNALEVNGFIEGYYKTLGRFSFYWVNRAGHMVPADNPDAMDAILKHLIKDT